MHEIPVLTDMEIEVENEKFPVHRVILAQAPFFRAICYIAIHPSSCLGDSGAEQNDTGWGAEYLYMVLPSAACVVRL